VSRPAAFFDRDGTIIEERGFLADPAGAVLLPTVPEALRALRASGFALVVVSNQSGIARGLLGHDDVRAVNAEIARRLAAHGTAIDAWYWCPHADEDCACRKPAPGMIHAAVADLDLDIAGGRGAVVGDRGSDVALGHAVGLAGIAVPSPYPYVGPEPDLRAGTLLEAAQFIIEARPLASR
jgi:histidinol-phosphate phosphatase family protein